MQYVWFRVKIYVPLLIYLLYYIFDIIVLSLNWLMLQISEISPFKYKNNVIRRLKFYWVKYKSRRSAVGGRRLHKNQSDFVSLNKTSFGDNSVNIYPFNTKIPPFESSHWDDSNEYKITKIGSSVPEISRKFSNYYIYALCKS